MAEPIRNKKSGRGTVRGRLPLRGCMCWKVVGERTNANSRVAARLFDSWNRQIVGIEIVMAAGRWGFVFPGAVPGPATLMITEAYNNTITQVSETVVLA